MFFLAPSLFQLREQQRFSLQHKYYIYSLAKFQERGKKNVSASAEESDESSPVNKGLASFECTLHRGSVRGRLFRPAAALAKGCALHIIIFGGIDYAMTWYIQHGLSTFHQFDKEHERARFMYDNKFIVEWEM